MHYACLDVLARRRTLPALFREAAEANFLANFDFLVATATAAGMTPIGVTPISSHATGSPEGRPS